MVLPVGDRNPTRRRAWVTLALVATNVAVFLLVQPPGQGCEAGAFLYRWAVIPAELLTLDQLPTGEVARSLGEACAATVGDKSVTASALTAMFLHANLAHLFGNMLYLWVFGNNVEDRLGRLRYLGFYLGGGLVATVAFAVLNPSGTQPLLGASGAVAAVLGAYLVAYPRAAVHTYVPFPLYLLAALAPRVRITGWFLFFAIVTMPAWLVLLGWFLFQLFAASSPAADGGVAYQAHVAGFVAGMVLLLALDRRRRRRGVAPLRRVR